MGATNHTTNYNLSQFVGTDKPAWLQDYNGDMTKIDTGINGAKVAADAAQLSADNAQADATTATTAITNTINPAITSLQTTVGSQGGAINTINSLIGNGTPTTTDQTIIGAINELNAGKAPANREYVQVYSDGVKTWGQLLDELHALIDFTKVKNDSYFEIVDQYGANNVYQISDWNNISGQSRVKIDNTYVASHNLITTSMVIYASGSTRDRVTCNSTDGNITYTDYTSTVKEADTYLRFVY